MATARLSVSTPQRFAAIVSEALFAAGAEGLEEQGARTIKLITYAENPHKLEALWAKARALLAERGIDPARGAAIEASIETLADESWKSRWTEHLKPVQLTRWLWLAPTTAPMPGAARAERVIVYEPALAFGDGDHPTTRLAARAVEAHYRARPGGALLDIGAGNGVLCFVATRSGAARALGIDIDPAAVEAAERNAALNDLKRVTRFRTGATRVVGPFDLVVINIELRPLLSVLAKLPRAAKEASKLLVTGFLASQRDDVASAIERAGFLFVPGRPLREGDWQLLCAARR